MFCWEWELSRTFFDRIVENVYLNRELHATFYMNHCKIVKLKTPLFNILLLKISSVVIEEGTLAREACLSKIY